MFAHAFNVINDMFFSKTDEKNKKTMKKVKNEVKNEKTNSHKLEETVVKRNVFNNGSGDLVVNAFYASTILNSTNDNGSKSSSHYSHSENCSNDGGDSGGSGGD